MKYILKFLGRKNETARSVKSPVYAFFAEADATEKARAYKKALKSASEDQMSILSRYDKRLSRVR